jgi:hypothetical protein
VIASCEHRPPLCKRLELTSADIEVWEVDDARVILALQTLLDIQPALIGRPAGKLLPIGELGIRAGDSLATYLAFPEPSGRLTAGDLLDASAHGIALTPTGRFADPPPASWRLLSLDQMLVFDGRSLIASEQGISILERLRSDLRENLQAKEPLAWSLPPNARWGELAFEFVEAVELKVSFRGETRSFDPGQLGMNKKNNGKPTNQWVTLQAIAQTGGQLTWASPSAGTKVKKQKQLLCEKLKLAFGIRDDPIRWDKRAAAYVCEFTIRGTPLGFRRAQEARGEFHRLKESRLQKRLR